jgi:hypothetical protein
MAAAAHLRRTAASTTSSSVNGDNNPAIAPGRIITPYIASAAIVRAVDYARDSSSDSIAASSSGVPWTFGPVNHLRAETSQ